LTELSVLARTKVARKKIQRSTPENLMNTDLLSIGLRINIT
jgi:hypothetical protein